MSIIATDVWSFFVCVRSASIELIFLRWNFEAGQILCAIFLSSMMLFKRFEFSIFQNLTASYTVYRNQGKFKDCKLLLELFRLIAINCGKKM